MIARFARVVKPEEVTDPTDCRWREGDDAIGGGRHILRGSSLELVGADVTMRTHTRSNAARAGIQCMVLPLEYAIWTSRPPFSRWLPVTERWSCY